MKQLSRLGALMLVALLSVGNAQTQTSPTGRLNSFEGKAGTLPELPLNQRWTRWALAMQAHVRNCIGDEARERAEIAMKIGDGGRLAEPPKVTAIGDGDESAALVDLLKRCAPYPDPGDLPAAAKDSQGALPVRFYPSRR